MKDERLDSEFGTLVIKGSTAKKYCGNSNYVRLPGFVYIVGTEAFKDSNVKYITLPSTATKIRDKAFLNCQNLEVIEFSRGLVEIGEYAFRNCTSLAEINFKGTKMDWFSIKKGEGWLEDAGEVTIRTYDAIISKEEQLEVDMATNANFFIEEGKTEAKVQADRSGKSQGERRYKKLSEYWCYDEKEDDDEDSKENKKLCLRVLDFCIDFGRVSESLIQHRFGTDYHVAHAIITWMSDRKFISEPMGIRGCRVLITRELFNSLYGDVDLSEDDDAEDKEDDEDYRLNIEEDDDDFIGDDEEQYLQYNALKLCIEKGVASVSLIQRSFPIGYNKACKLIHWMEEKSYVSKASDSRPRKVLINEEQFNKIYDDDSQQVALDKLIRESIKDYKPNKEDKEDDYNEDELLDDIVAIGDNSEDISSDQEPDCSLWKNKTTFRKEVLRRFYAVIKSNPRQGLASAIKNAEARLEGVKDALNYPMIQVYERVVFDLKHTTPYRYNVIRRKLCGK